MWRVCTFEERVILAAKFGRQSAIHFLLAHWEQPKNRLVTSVARQYGLSEQDAADARQEAVFWLLDAIRKYRFEGPPQLREFRLKAFLRQKLRRNMSNFVRSQRRQVRFETESRTSVGEPTAELAERYKRRNTAIDPAVQCERDELRVLTRRAIADCGTDCQQLSEILRNGGTMREAAKTLHMTYHVVRTTRARIARVLESISAAPEQTQTSWTVGLAFWEGSGTRTFCRRLDALSGS